MSTSPVPRPPSDPAQSRRRVRKRRPHLPVSNETSAGGIAIRVDDGTAYAAVIGRRNRHGKLEWCLPKGHLENEETPREAAIREIAEEAGVHGDIVHSLGVIDYWFTGDDRRVHKVVHHFLLETDSDAITTENDPDQEAEVAEWVPLDQLVSRLAFPKECRVARIAVELLADHA